ncbi:MAG: PAS domain S-box protein [SAR324 cluster bacterium]|nr:PAS domain S-box protein [SAR324 cluster bacterium]
MKESDLSRTELLEEIRQLRQQIRDLDQGAGVCPVTREPVTTDSHQCLPIDELPVPLALYNVRLQCMYANSAYLTMLAVKPDPVRGHLLEQVWGALYKFMEKPAMAALSGAQTIIECELDHREGSPCMEISIIPWQTRKTIDGFFVMLKDISSFHQIEIEKELLVEEKALLFQAIDQASEIFMITDVNGIIEYVNTSFEKITGFTAEEVLGQPTSIFKSDRHEPVFFKEMWDTLTIGETWKGIITNKKKDGSLYEEELSISPVRNYKKDVTHYVCIKRDITNEILLEKQLRHYQKVEAIGTLAGGVAHDFNNILQGIFISVEMAMTYLPKGTPATDYLNQILTLGKRGSDLVKQIMTFSRRDEGVFNLLSLDIVVHEVLKMIRATLPSTIEINASITENCPLVYGNIAQLHQVIVNLCTNAGYAMRESGGVLTVCLELCTLTCYEPDLSLSPGTYMCLKVEDTGVGIPEENLDRVFDPFFTTKPQGEGTGLGLSVVQGTVKNHGGSITIKSEVGKGSTFTVLIPVAEKSFPLQEAVEDIKHQGNERILLVDDEKVITEMSREMLENYGYQVTSTTNSLEALQFFTDAPQNFDVVITDHTMPLMTGVQLAEKILAIRPDIPVILISGYNQSVTQTAAKASGIRAFIMKPIEKNHMAQTIRDVLSNKDQHSR